MANALYDFGRESFLGGNVDWDTDTIKVTLCDEADYAVNLTTDDYYNDVTVAGRVATSSALTTPTIAAGVADADNITYTSVTGDISESLTIWQDTTVEATSILIGNIDTATGLPVTPNGGNITVTWDSGANKIFKL